MDTDIAQEQESLTAVYRRYLAATVLFHLAAADSVGLAAVDYQAASLLELDGPMSNGELARRLALSTGATTRLVDRLEAHGLAHRTVAADDRRRAVIAHGGALPDRLEAVLDSVRGPIGEAVESMTPDQLDALRTYLDVATSTYLATTRALSDADR